jgi:thiol-disulfide isomerase/thioredoxin
MSNWSYQKIFFIGIVAFAAVIGGTWVGGALFQKEPLAVQAEGLGIDYDELDARYASFTIGDHFPWEDCLYPDGSRGDFDALRDGRPALYIFSSTSCGPCLSLLAYLHKVREEKLREDVMLVVCVPSDLRPVGEDFAEVAEGMKLVFIDRAYWAAQYQIAFWPTIVGVDASGFVQHIQFGYPEELDKEIPLYFFRPN